ncbi:WG repeat-containing protein [Echinicola marina]|uniref:WG repeat-containing protein n=1 Tax=Echinicola marina TaxID=2859768 RepID=UPI001CF69AC3|nr:WG repeat-containing protein [Echinicola marina]UCS92173.1 WG repeat-containing protein [Echinicola marina]
MNTKNLIIPLTVLLLCFAGSVAFGQHTQTHKVNFSDIDGFSGEVNFTSSRHSFGTTLKGKGTTLVLKNYRCTPEEKEALKKAGIDFWGYSGYSPKTFGVYVEGRAYVNMVRGYSFNRYAKSPKILHLNNGLGDEVSFDFDEDTKEYETEWKKTRPDKVLWLEEGGFSADKVTELYLSDLKNEIDRILYAAKKEKQKEEQEKAEQKMQETEAKESETSSDGSGGSSDNSAVKEEKSDNNYTDTEPKESGRKGAQTVYYPKTNRQLYDELKALTDATPALLNDPNVRSQLRNYKAFADRDGRNIQALKTSQMISGGRYNPAVSNYLNQTLATNAEIANVEMGVGAAVDAATELINNIVEANNRKEQERVAEIQRANQNFDAKAKALDNYRVQLAKNRQEFEESIKTKIIENYDSRYHESIGKSFSKGFTVLNGIIRYETEVPVRSNDPTKKPYFEKKTRHVGSYVDKSVEGGYFYHLYVVKKGGKYGILNDYAEPIYLPQFDDIKALSLTKKDYSENRYSLKDLSPRFLVKINDKWGEVLSDGSVSEEIKYDGIWYCPNYQIILKLGDKWTIKPIGRNNNEEGRNFTTSQIKEKFDIELIPIYMGYRGNMNSPFSSSPRQMVENVLTLDGKEHTLMLYTSDKDIFPVKKELGVIYARHSLIGEDGTNVWIFPFKDDWYQISFKEVNFDEYTDYHLKKMPDEFLSPIASGSTYLKNYHDIRWGVINQNGELVIPIENKSLELYDKLGFRTEQGYYDNDGVFFTSEEMFLEGFLKKENPSLNDEEPEMLNNAFSLITINNKKGIVDARNNIVVPIKYDEIGTKFNEENMTWFRDGNHYGMADVFGGEVFRIELPSEKKPENIDDFYFLGGLYFSGNDSKSFIELKGNTIAIHNTAILGLRPTDFNEENVDVEVARYFYSKIPSTSIWYDLAQMRLKYL